MIYTLEQQQKKNQVYKQVRANLKSENRFAQTSSASHPRSKEKNIIIFILTRLQIKLTA